ncbi:MAG: leucine-rich repeat domain-containing protein, partial [Alistipes sp.]|nr:leucine-rich repeat domain-containing protein [Alistipes sp.]
LTSLFIPDRVTTIGNKAFKNAAITEINHPEGVASIGDEAFLGTQLSTIAFPASLTTIGAAAFQSTLLSTITLPNAIETIKENAFAQTQISSITLPGSLTWLGYNAFSYCPNLKTVTFSPSATATPLKLDAPVGSNQNNIHTPFYTGNISEYEMDDEEIAENRARSLQTVTLNRELVKAHDEVPMALFRYHTALTNLTIGEQVKTIGSYMFANSGLTSVELPSSVTSVEKSAFMDCKNLTTLTAYGKLHIGHSAFAGSELQTVNLNGGVNGIERAGFARCKLTSFYMNETTSSGAIAERAFENSKIPALTIPGGITSIGNEAFLLCTNLKRISFLAGTTPLEMGFDEGYVLAYQGEHGIFFECPLNEIFVDRDMTFTEEYADAMDEADEGIFSYVHYDNDTHKTTVTLGQNITTIPLRMFSNSAITSLTIPANVTKIEEWAFDNCLKLTSVTIEQGTTPLTIGYNMYGSSEYSTFYDCPLSNVYCGRDIVQVNDKDEVSPADGWEEGVFANKYDQLTSINLGGKLTKILPYMFADTEATGVWIPNIVTSIGDYAF